MTNPKGIELLEFLASDNNATSNIFTNPNWANSEKYFSNS